MFLNRAGRFLLFISVGAFILRHIGMQILPSRVALMVGGVGVGLIVLGAMFGGSPAKPRRSRVAPFPPGVSSARVCTNCRAPLRAGARFCTRCGIAVASPPPITAPLPTSVASGQQKNDPKPRKGFPWVRGALVVACAIYGVKAISDWRETGRVPWDDWQWARELGSSISTEESESVPLPVAPEPGKPASVVTGPDAGAYIDHAWVETGAVDDQGYVGLRVHALINAAGSHDVRFAAHFRHENLAPVISAIARYTDARGQAATAVRVSDLSHPAEITAFIPYTALYLHSPTESLQLLPSLYDAVGRPLGVCQTVPFTVYRGPIYITRVRLDSGNQSSPYGGPQRKLLVSFHSSETRSVVGDVVVRFKDDHGRTIPGQYEFAAKELRLTTGFTISPSRGDVTTEDLPVEIPPGTVPARATAEISLYDNLSGASLTPPLLFKMP